MDGLFLDDVLLDMQELVGYQAPDWIDSIPNEDDLKGRGFGFFSRRLESGDPGRLPASGGCPWDSPQSEWDDSDREVSLSGPQEGGQTAFRKSHGEGEPATFLVRKVVRLEDGDECDPY